MPATYNYDARLDRALDLWLAHAVTQIGVGRYTVASATEKGTIYHVTDGVCNCWDCQKWQKDCKHSLACELWEAERAETPTGKVYTCRTAPTYLPDGRYFKRLPDGRYERVECDGAAFEVIFPDTQVIFDTLPTADRKDHPMAKTLGW